MDWKGAEELSVEIFDKQQIIGHQGGFLEAAQKTSWVCISSGVQRWVSATDSEMLRWHLTKIGCEMYGDVLIRQSKDRRI